MYKLIAVLLPVYVLGFLLSSCSTARKAGADKASLPDGMYLVLAEYIEEPAKTPKGVVTPFSHDFLLDAAEDDPRFLLIDPADYVELKLTEKPQQAEQPNKKINLHLSLAPDEKEQLAAFSEKNLNKTVAIVIGGQAVTKHKVKAVLDSGKLQISWCTPFACERLLVELEDNVGRR